MLKVLHIVLGLRVGGLEKFVLDLTSEYKNDVESTILCLSDNEPDLQFETSCKTVRWNKKQGLSIGLIFEIVKHVKSENYDIIHTHNSAPHFYGSVAGLISGVLVVHTKHGRNHPKNYKRVLLNRISSFLTCAIVAVSSDAADVCTAIEHVPASKVHTILNGIDTSSFKCGKGNFLKDELGLSSDTLLIGIVARLSPEKNHSLLLEACGILKEKFSRFHLIIIGDGRLHFELETQVEESGLAGVVSFLGTRSDIPSLIRDLDVYVLSSTTEGISLTLLEAMSSCVPVVATDVGGNPEVVKDGMTGFIVPQNALAMSERIEELLLNRELRVSMGAKGRERVLEKFSLTKVAEKYLELYKIILGS